MHKEVFATSLTEAYTTDVEGLGCARIENDPIIGTRAFRWVRNKSGGSLAINSAVGWELGQAAVTAATNTTANQIIRGSGTWTEGELSDFYVRVLDDAGAAGAAPEGEVARIRGNTTTVITLHTSLTAAVTASDTFQVFRPWYVIASADAMVAAETAGVLMATLADGSYGWVQRNGFHLTALVVAAGTTLAAGSALKPGAGLLVAAADNADNGEVIGASVFAVTTDTVLRTAPVLLSLPS